MQSIPSKLVKRAYPLLILLAIMLNTSGGQLPITRAIASRPTGCDAATFKGIADSQIKKKSSINVCYYLKQTSGKPDSDCQGSYNMPANQYCVEILQPNTNTTGCPATTSADIAGGTLYIYQTTCFYLKTAKASCAGNYNTTSAPACTAPKDSSSNSSSNSSSSTSNRPAGCDPATFKGITDSQIQKNSTINVCYYFKQTAGNPDSDCQGSYNMPANQYCVEILQPDTTTTSCPSTTGADIAGATLYIYQTTCFYLKTSNASCTGSYKNSSPPACTAACNTASSTGSANTSNATNACNTDGNCKQNSNCNQDSGQYIHTGYDDPAGNNACLYTNSSITNCSSNLVHLDGSCFVDSTKSNSPPAIANGLRSDGCPATPAGTKTTPAITPSVNTAVGSQCFYTPLGTTTCAANYDTIGTSGDTICVGYKNNAKPTAVNTANSQCPTPPNGAGTLSVLIQTCFYLATTNALCPPGNTNGYSFTVPDCHALVTGNTSSGFDKNGCPIPAPATTASPTLEVSYQICYYQLAQGLQCATNYNSGPAGGPDCLAYTNGSSPITPASGQCPTAPQGAGTVYIAFNGSICYFLYTDKSQCTGSYSSVLEPACTAIPTISQNGTNNSLALDAGTPKPGCPSSPLNGVTYTLSNGTCTGNDSAHSTMSPTCSQGYVTNSGGGCSFNAAVDLPDVSNGPCTLKNAGEEEGEGAEGEEGGPRLYTCPYANATLDCVISGSGSKAMEDCYMGTGAYDSTAKTYDSSLSYYECPLNSNNDPTSCTYYGPKDTAKTTQSATSACTPPANAGSSLSDCMITTCFNTSTSKFISCSNYPTPQANYNIIEVHIEQQCTSQRDGAVLSCTYVSTHHITNKSRYYQITCSQIPPLSCTSILGPYTSNLNRNCSSPDQTTNYSSCFTQDNANTNAWVWRAQCRPYDNSPNYFCGIWDTNSKSTNALGLVHCTSGGTCTITDNNGNTMTLNSCGTAPTFNCKSTTPGCPVTKLPGTTTPVIAESDLTCRGELVLDSLMTPAMTSLTIQYPLSEGELQFALTGLGIGGQSWLTQNGEVNLPAGSGGIVGL